ncbi:MAG: ribonuclease P protein component, partial [Nocardioides sp.]|nr:ribonuclease P protein component [Nocardioides sp.]
MLPAAHRLRDGATFREAIRRGRRAGRRTLVVHLVVGEPAASQPVRIGLVVSRAVG